MRKPVVSRSDQNYETGTVRIQVTYIHWTGGGGECGRGDSESVDVPEMLHSTLYSVYTSLSDSVSS